MTLAMAACARPHDGYVAPPPMHPGYVQPYLTPPPRPAAAKPVAATAPSNLSRPVVESVAAPTDRSCVGELRRRRISFERVENASGVEQPVRLLGPVSGVTIRFSAARSVGGGGAHDVLDCRLARALGDWAPLLASHGVVEVVHMSLYRKGAVIATSGKPSQHSRGLAIDVGELRLRDGRRLNVLDHWQGAIGQPVCGVNHPAAAIEARLLRSIICATADARIFQLLLTPNYNAAHANHFHLDVQPGRPTLAPR